MFFHIFRNTFITNSHIPGEIEINYKISKDKYMNINPVNSKDYFEKK